MTNHLKTKGYVGGDFIISEDAPPIVTREQLTYTNASSTDYITLPAGQPMKSNGTAILATDEASLYGLLVEPVTLGPSEVRKLTVLRRGPACVNFDALPTDDPAGDAYTAATLKTAIAALGIVWRLEPTTQETQTT